LVRPLGAVVLGRYADRVGRKSALTLSIALMSAGTLAMALVPSYATIGIAAPIIVLVARLLQGFSVGGEFGSSTAFLVEHSPVRKGFYASWQSSGQGLAGALASAFGIALSTLMDPADLQSWGWRLPFFFGLLVAPVGLYIRKRLGESPEFLNIQRSVSPVREVIITQWKQLCVAIGLVALSTSANYVLLYMPIYGVREFGLPQSIGLTATLSGGILLAICAPFAGHMADRFGRVRSMALTSGVFIATAWLGFELLSRSPTLATMLVVVLWFSLVKSAYSGILPSLMAELFPTETRSTGLSLSYNLAVPIFGGFAPFIVASLIEITKSGLAPAYYLMFTGTISLTALVVARRKFGIR
jgi:MFS transporter, MHS family, proline/betaine transporter